MIETEAGHETPKAAEPVSNAAHEIRTKKMLQNEANLNLLYWDGLRPEMN